MGHAHLGKSSKHVSDTEHTCAGAHECPCAVTPLRTQSGLLWICANVRFNWNHQIPLLWPGLGGQSRGDVASGHHSTVSLLNAHSCRLYLFLKAWGKLQQSIRLHSGSSNVLHPTEIKAGIVGHSLCNKSTWTDLLTKKGLVLHARGPGHTHVLQFCKMSLGRRSHFLLFPILAHSSELTTYDSPTDQINSSC